MYILCKFKNIRKQKLKSSISTSLNDNHSLHLGIYFQTFFWVYS